MGNGSGLWGLTMGGGDDDGGGWKCAGEGHDGSVTIGGRDALREGMGGGRRPFYGGPVAR
jgi:hypothetical protein